jgi:hypothetical protein
MTNVIYISKKCPHSKQLLIVIYKNPMLKDMFKIIAVDDSPVPPFIKTVPTLFNETNNTIISGTDLFNLIKSYTEQSQGGEREHFSAAPEPDTPKSGDDDELSPWSIGEMGGSVISSCYSFLDNDNPIQNNFELIGDAPVSGGMGELQAPTMSNDSAGSKTDKRQMFDSDYENFIKNRNEGIPNSTNRA